MAVLDGRYLVGIFGDDEVLMQSIPKIRKEGVKIQEVYTPFPIHGLDHAIGHPRTRIGIAAFLFGLLGFCCALALTIWTMGIDWPMNVGGKDPISIPNYIPVTFEMTVLFTAYGMTIAFFIVNGLRPEPYPQLFDKRVTDNKFAMAIDLKTSRISEEEITRVLIDNGAEEVNVKQF